MTFCVSVSLITRSRSNEEAYSFEIWYRDFGESFRGTLKDIFLQTNPDFFQIFF